MANLAADDSLFDAVIGKDVRRVERLLATKAVDVNGRRLVDGATALHVAVESAEPNIVERLLKCCAVDVNARDDAGDTPLHRALVNEETTILYLLLGGADGLDLSVRNAAGFNAFHYAALFCAASTVGVLASRDRRYLRVPKSDGYLPLHVAALNGRAHVVQELLSWDKTCANQVTADGRNALHLVAAWPNDESDDEGGARLQCARALLEAQTDVNGRDDAGDSPLHLCIRSLAARCARHSLPPPADAVASLRLLRERSLDAIAAACPSWPQLALASYLIVNGASLDVENVAGLAPRAALRTSEFDLVWDAMLSKRSSVPTRERNVSSSCERTCTICMDRQSAFVFGCDHVACDQCAFEIDRCHICRQPIDQRLPFFH